MRKWGGWLLVGLVIAVAFAGSSGAQEGGSDAPYLYYYSDVLNAFVIERADGTDSRVFGDGVMPEGTFSVDGPGWSPSGQWFAWISNITIADNQGHLEKPFAISVDGTRRLTSLDDMAYAFIKWSPSEDVLLVRETDRYGMYGDESTITIYLIDAPTNTILASFSDFFSLDNSGCEWLNNGQQVICRYLRRENDELQHIWMVIDKNGNLKKYSDDTLAEYGTLLHHNYDTWPIMSSSGDFAFLDENRNVLKTLNLVTASMEQIALSELSIDLIDWVSGNLMIRAKTTGCEGEIEVCGYQLWSLSSTTRKFERIGERIVKHLVTQDGKWILLWSIDGHFRLCDLETRATAETDIPSQDPDLSRDMRWYWVTPTRLIIYGLTDSIYRYDIDLQTVEIIEQTVAGRPVFSADGRYMAYAESYEPAIYDLANNNQRTAIKPHNRAFRHLGGGFFNLNWHYEKDWLIEAESDDFNSGAFWFGITNADGSVRREFDFCHPSSICLEWLPVQVNVADLPVLLDYLLRPMPTQILQSEDWIFALEWSPDSKQLAAGQGDLGKIDTFEIWDVPANEIVASLDVHENTTQVVWEPEENGPYRATLMTGHGEEGILMISPDGTHQITKEGVLDAATGAVLLDISVSTASFSPDGQLLALGSFFNDVAIYSRGDLRLLMTLPTASAAVAFSPDGTQLAVGSSWDIQIWDVAELLAWGQEIEQGD